MNEENLPVLPKKNSKFSVALSVLSFLMVAVLVAVVIYMFVGYIPSFANGEDGAAAIVLVVFIPLIIAFAILSGVSSILLLVLGILLLQNKDFLCHRKAYVIFTAVVDFVVIAGLVFLTALSPKTDIFFLLSDIFMLIYFVFKIVALSICGKTKEN
ncbi:MAG: hypothetical protein ACI4R8_00315 [Candidatus Caccovivens sp.]